MSLTTHQDKIVKEVLSNLGSKGLALLSGIAGTGKSYCTEEIVKKYIFNKKKVMGTGTTHKSVEVLQRSIPRSMSHQVSVKTIHSYCNMQMSRDGSETKFVRNHKKEIEKVDLLIIDEMSMLTSDVLEVISELHDKGTEILMVGDISQLILDKEAIGAIDIKDVASYLLEPVRQLRDSDIAMYSKMASQAILGFASLPSIPYGDEIIQYDNHKDFIEAWKNSNHTDKIILAYQNSTVNAYNRNIKKKYMFQEEEYMAGNMITLRAPVHTHEENLLYNKMRIEIRDVEEADNGNSYKIYYQKDSNDYFLVPKTKTWLDDRLQPYIIAKDWTNFYYIKDRYVQVHHAEAQTTHSSQGDTYEEVFIDGRDLMLMKTQDDLERAIYVAISRAKEKVHIFVGAERKYDAFSRKIEEIS